MRDNRLLVEHLMKRSGRKLYSMLFRMSLREDVAEEILQDLVVKLLQSEGFRKAKSQEAFAVRCAQRLAIDRWRQENRERERTGPEQDGQVRHGEGLDAAAICERRDEFEKVFRALAQLSESQRECIVLRYIEGLDNEAIASITGSTPHRVRGLTYRGILRLKSLLVERDTRLEPIENED